MGSLSGGGLTAGALERDPSSYVDPNGYLFHHDGAIHRAIRRRVVPFYRRLLDGGVIGNLVAHKHLVPTAPADVPLDDPDIGLVLRHERVEPVTYCVEWCPPMLRDAALATVDLLDALLPHGATLQDAYPWNVLFDGTKPVFVDFTSIVELDSPYLWPAYAQYQAFFLRPLLLAEQGKGAIARALLLDNIGGISRGTFFRNASLRYKLAHPGAGISHLADLQIQKRPHLKRRLREAAAQGREPPDTAVRARFYRGLRRELEAVRVAGGGDVWTAYYGAIAPEVDKEAKLRQVGDLLARLRPDTVLDLGCNTGVFSIRAAECGARVMAMDSSEDCISRLYEEAKDRGLRVTPVVADVLCPTPAFGFMGTQYPSLMERARSDLVLCLGLMHHLHVAGRQPFDRIARLLDALAGRHVIFEFVGMDDPNNALIGAGREIAYDLESVTAALRRHFPTIETRASDRPTRRILVCSKER